MNKAEQDQLNVELATANAIVHLAMEKGLLAEVQEACDEVERELGVRDRCYPKWLDVGKLSKTEARDRMNRMVAAFDILRAVRDACHRLPDTGVTSSGDKTTPEPF